MTKSLVPLLVLALTLTIAPAALANHCRRCHPITGACVTALNFGWALCTTIGPGDCDLDQF